MLSPDDNPGVFYFLVGMVVLVMTAVGLSTVMDKRFKFSSGVGEIKREIAISASDLAELRARHEAKSMTLANLEAKRGPASAGRKETLEKVATLAQRKSELLASRDKLRESITATETVFSDYRAAYRRKTWAKAVGEVIGNLTLRGGKEYRQATITKVTDVGLEIRHEHGIARVQAPDLDQGWQDRFQWSDEERRARLKEESASLDGKPVGDGPPSAPREQVATVVPPSKMAAVTKGEEPAKVEELKALRTQFIGWKTKVRRLRNDQMEASSNAGYGNKTSVPGSLETWKSRSARLGKELSRAQIELAKAQARLAAVSPEDLLLRPVAGEEE